MKVMLIALKDTLTRFRDRNGILLMLAAPLVLASVIGAAFSGLDSSTQLRDIPVALVDEDNSPVSQAFVLALNEIQANGLLKVTAMDDVNAGRRAAADGAVAGAVIIPAGFMAAVGEGQAAITVYTDPGSSVGLQVVAEAVAQVAAQFNASTMAPSQGNAVSPDVGSQAGDQSQPADSQDPASSQGGALAYFAPAMAVLFLMFTLFDAASSILEEERQGTLARMMVSPTRFGPILLGKLLGVFVTGALQLTVLILASRLLFGLHWGPLGGIVLMVIALSGAASALGACIVAFSRNEQQAGVVSAAIAMIFAILGGNFFDTAAYPAWLQPLSRLTLNRWALDGFTDLTRRGLSTIAVLPEAGVLLAAAVVLVSVAMWRLPKRFVR